MYKIKKMEIQHRQEGSKGAFYVEQENNIDAEMTYSMAGESLMIIDHTEVADALRGKNVGYQLVKTAVTFAREHHLKILPLCPFAKAVFEKKKDELGDVLREA